MKKTYIEPNIEVIALNYGVVLAGSLFGQEYVGNDITGDETVEGD